MNSASGRVRAAFHLLVVFLGVLWLQAPAAASPTPPVDMREAARALAFGYDHHDDDQVVSLSMTTANRGALNGPLSRRRCSYDDCANVARTNARVETYRSAPQATRAVVGAADDVPLHSPNFVVHPNGEIVPVPTGAIGQTPVRTGSGFQFRGGSGGHGLDPRVTDVRIMDPVLGGKHPLPNGYVSYANASGQTVNPWTGRTVDPSNPWWHWGWSSP